MYNINIFQISELCKRCNIFLMNQVLKLYPIWKYKLISPWVVDTGTANFDKVISCCNFSVQMAHIKNWIDKRNEKNNRKNNVSKSSLCQYVMYFPDAAGIHEALYGVCWCEPPDVI